MIARPLTCWMLVLAVLMLPCAACLAAGKAPAPEEKAAKGVLGGEKPDRGALEKAAEAARAAKVEPVVIRMYNVQDLTLGRDFPYRSSVVPPTSLEPYAAGVEMGEGSAGLFAAAGGAQPQVGDQAALSSAMTPDVISEIMKRTVDPESWEDEGGRGRVQRVGALLIITQTAANHARIVELLEQFRTARQMVSIEAMWVLLDDAQSGKLLGDPAKRSVPPEVTPAAMQESGAAVIYRGQITCFDRQTVHLASGRAQTIMIDMEPVVAESAIGFDVQPTALLWGALLEATPVLAPDGKSITLRLHSLITEGQEVRTAKIQSAIGGSDSKGASPVTTNEIELPEFLMHTFRTTIRAPLGKAFLVGGMTGPRAADGKVLYLILEITASK